MTVRLYDLAKELGIESKALVDWFKQNQVQVVSASSRLTAEQVDMARKHIHDEPGASPERTWSNVTRESLRQGWVGSTTVLNPTSMRARPAPSDGHVHAHTQDIADTSLCGRKLRYTDLMPWPPKSNEPCPMCWHEAEKIPQKRRPNNPFA